MTEPTPTDWQCAGCLLYSRSSHVGSVLVREMGIENRPKRLGFGVAHCNNFVSM